MVRERVPQRPNLLRVVLQLLEVRVEREARPLPVGGGDDAEDASARADVGLERELTQDPRQIGVRALERRVRELELAELLRGKRVLQELADLGRPLKRAERPGQRKHVAEPGVGVEQGEGAINVLRLDVLHERVEPESRNLLRVDVLRNSRHAEAVECGQCHSGGVYGGHGERVERWLAFAQAIYRRAREDRSAESWTPRSTDEGLLTQASHGHRRLDHVVPASLESSRLLPYT